MSTPLPIPSPAPIDDTVAALPASVDKRLNYWHSLWTRSAAYHYLFGVVSVAASVISTSTDGTYAKIFSTIAAIATAMIGFMHPERRYMKFVRAWRVLDVAALRYQHGLINRAALFDALEKGESLLAEFEDKYGGSTDTTQQNAADAVATAQASQSPTASPSASPPASPPALPIPLASESTSGPDKP